MSGELSTPSTEALTVFARNRLRDGEALERIRAAVASARVPEWAFGNLVRAARARDLLTAFFRHRDQELTVLRDALRRQGSATLAALGVDDGVTVSVMPRAAGACGGVRPPRGSDDADRCRVHSVDPPPGMAAATSANPKAVLVDHGVELPGWREATFRYTDVDGGGFEHSAPGLPPVPVSVVTAVTFHDFTISTESDDRLECALARYGRQLEEAELIGRAMGSRLGVMGEFVIPLWLSSPEAIGVAAERLSIAVADFDASMCRASEPATVVFGGDGDAHRVWRGRTERTDRYIATVRRELYGLLGYLHLTAADLKCARDICADLVVEHHGAIIAAKERMLRELTGQTGDGGVLPPGRNPAPVLLTMYESAVATMNDAIATTVIAELGLCPDRDRIRQRVHQLDLVPDGVMNGPLEPERVARFPG